MLVRTACSAFQAESRAHQLRTVWRVYTTREAYHRAVSLRRVLMHRTPIANPAHPSRKGRVPWFATIHKPVSIVKNCCRSECLATCGIPAGFFEIWASTIWFGLLNLLKSGQVARFGRTCFCCLRKISQKSSAVGDLVVCCGPHLLVNPRMVRNTAQMGDHHGSVGYALCQRYIAVMAIG